MFADGKTPSICIIGAGFSGLTAAIQLQRQLNLSSFTIYDENNEVGGTWLVNTYPGCACDVQSHFYSWSFEPNPNWTETYSSQPEILEYIKGVAKKYNIYPHIKFNTQVKGLVWNEVTKQWDVTVWNKTSNIEKIESYDVIMNGPGILRQPNIPEEFKNFKGPIIHSAQWDSSIDLENKIVAIVGSGASAVQIIPNIAPRVKELHCFQRKPAWVASKGLRALSPASKWIFRYIPLAMWLYRCYVFLSSEFFWFGLLHKSWLSKKGREGIIDELAEEIKDEVLQQKLTPNYEFGCKRITFASNYYQAFNLPHVKLHMDDINLVDDQHIKTANGETKKIEVLVLATGFKVQDYFAPMMLVGKDGKDIMSIWKNEGPQLYYGIVGPELPNHFILLGPNTGLGDANEENGMGK